LIKLLLDQGVPYSAASHLTAAGWDAIHTSEVGMQRASDRQILDYSASEERICVTLDADFHMLLAINNLHSPSVIRIRREGLKGEGIARLLLEIWPIVGEKLKKNAMVTVTDKNIRVRYLPVSANQF
jgi:predicted nuclease of predicted toxin-antitoxin system